MESLAWGVGGETKGVWGLLSTSHRKDQPEPLLRSWLFKMSPSGELGVSTVISSGSAAVFLGAPHG